ncbi:MAG: AbiJ-NTD4 domain-containing protein [Pseudanabaena sp.]
MTIFETFSKRQKRHRGDVPDVYVYEEISKSLRVQIVHIIRDTIGQGEPYSGYSPRDCYAYIHKSLCKEYGVFTLKEYARSDDEAVLDYLLNCDSYERCLDIVEICFRIIENYVAHNYDYYKQTTTSTRATAHVS